MDETSLVRVLYHLDSENHALRCLIFALIGNLDSRLPSHLAEIIENYEETIPTAPDGVIVLHLSEDVRKRVRKAALVQLAKKLRSFSD